MLLVGPVPRLGAPNHLPWLRYTASALRRLGHTVTTTAYRESWSASPALTSIASRVAAAPLLARVAAARAAARDRRVVAAARRARPELTVVLKGEVFPDEAIAWLKQFTAGPLVTWWVDDPQVYPASIRQFPMFDRVFLFDRSYMPPLESGGVKTAFLPCACDETVYQPQQLSAAERARLRTDVAFVASCYPQRAALVRALAPTLDVGVWGNGWAAFSNQMTPRGTPVWRGGLVADHMAAKIYSAAALGLNLHHPQSRLGGVNTRTFELLAAGTLPLVDRLAGMEELLDPEREVACYTSADEARDLAMRYVGDPGARAAIVQRGRARVLAQHTYVARMRELCRVACG